MDFRYLIFASFLEFWMVDFFCVCLFFPFVKAMVILNWRVCHKVGHQMSLHWPCPSLLMWNANAAINQQCNMQLFRHCKPNSFRSHTINFAAVNRLSVERKFMSLSNMPTRRHTKAHLALAEKREVGSECSAHLCLLLCRENFDYLYLVVNTRINNSQMNFILHRRFVCL
jgi:hypothetical protein